MTPKNAAKLFKVLGDSTRVKLLLAILANESEEMNVTQLVTDVGVMSQPAVSHHLSIMRAMGIVETERSGKNVVYSFTDSDEADAIRGMLAYVTEDETPKKATPKPKVSKKKAVKP